MEKMRVIKEIRSIHANMDRGTITFGYRMKDGTKGMLPLALKELPKGAQESLHNIFRHALPTELHEVYTMTLPEPTGFVKKVDTPIQDQGPVIELGLENLNRILQFGDMSDEVRSELVDLRNLLSGNVEDPLKGIFED